MELALAEKSIFVPPLIVGGLFLYRTMFGGVMTTHPITEPYRMVSLAFDTIYQSLCNLFNSVQSRTLVLKQSSVAVLNTLANNLSKIIVSIQRMMTMVVRNIHQMRGVVIQTFYQVVETLTNALSQIRFHFQTVTQQLFNSSSNMFTALQDKVVDFHRFFFPLPKTFYDYTYIGVAICLSILVIAFTIYYLSKSRVKTFEVPEATSEPVKTEPTPVRRNPVRRKAKMN